MTDMIELNISITYRMPEGPSEGLTQEKIDRAANCALMSATDDFVEMLVEEHIEVDHERANVRRWAQA